MDIVEVHQTFRKAPKRTSKARKPIRRSSATTRAKKPVKKGKPVKAIKWKFKKSELAKLDAAFSAKVRTRDGRCLFPRCEVSEFEKLQCSHYEGRQRWETRFDEDNCIALCMWHHYGSKLIGWEFAKQRAGEKNCDHDGKYTVFMKNLLGTRFEKLVNKPKQTRKEVMNYYTSLLPK